MTTREAGCACGQLRLVCEGAPTRISMCHCLSCQQRTGSVFAVQAWFPRERVHGPAGKATVFVRKADSGRTVTFNFCPDCGSTVFWVADVRPHLVAVSVGSFADPQFPPPQHSVYERRRHGWAAMTGDATMEHEK